MENPEQNELLVTKETRPQSLYTVTPLSKYLAMVLFVLLPFLGGWIGYTYAPDKVVGVDKVVTKEAPAKTATGGFNSLSPENDSVNISTALEETSLEQILCSDLPEIDDILGSLETNLELFWNRLIFEVENADCTKQIFASGNILYSMAAGCGYCFEKIYKDADGYRQLNKFSKLFNDQIVSVNDRSVEALDTRTNQSRTLARLDSDEFNKTFFAGEDQSSHITYDEVTNTISISVYDKNTCEIGHGGCHYTKIPSDLKTVKLP